jgi:hypothetical protein
MGIGKFITFCCCLAIARDWSWTWLKVDLSWPRIGCWLPAAELHLPTGPAAAATTPCLGARLSTSILTPNSSAAVDKGTTARSLLYQILRRPGALQGCMVRSSTTRSREEKGERETESDGGGAAAACEAPTAGCSARQANAICLGFTVGFQL